MNTLEDRYNDEYQRAEALLRVLSDTRDRCHQLKARVARLEEELRGCADALTEAGKDFALTNPRAVRPNLYELHAQKIRAALADKS